MILYVHGGVVRLRAEVVRLATAIESLFGFVATIAVGSF